MTASFPLALALAAVWQLAGPGEDAAGAAAADAMLAAWGRRTTIRTLPAGRPEQVAGASRAAALLDADGDGRLDLAVCETDPPALAWYAAPGWTRREIEAGVEADDLLPVALPGRRGLLAIHKGAELRFYEIPAGAATRPWPVRDLYSIYTPARQGGLALADIDGDGRDDLFGGNYWLRAPAAWEAPWRLFAINLWTEEEQSGVLSLARLGRILAAAQRELPRGRVALFTPPADPKELWSERKLGEWDRPVLAARGNDLVLAERGGAGRVVWFAAPDYAPQVLRTGRDARALLVWKGEVLLLARDGLWRARVE